MKTNILLKKFYLVFLGLFLLYLPFEKMNGKACKNWLYENTHIQTHVIKSLYFYPGDLVLILCSFLFIWRLRIDLGSFFIKGTRKFFLLFIMCCYLSLAFAPFETTLWNYLQLLFWITVFLCYCFAQEILSFGIKKEYLYRFFLGFVLVSCFQSVIGLLQYFMKGSLGLFFLGEVPNLDPNAAPSFWMNRWSYTLFDVPFHEGASSLLRAHGTFGHPNVFGGFLSLGILFTLSLYVSFQKKTSRLFLTMALFLQVIALFSTFSRSALFGCILGCFLWFIFYGNKVLFLRVAFIFGMGFCLFSPQILTRGGIVNYNSLSHESDHIRILSSKVAAEVMIKYPAFGAGLGNYQKATEGIGIKHLVHNVYLLIGAEMGFLGLIAFLLFVGMHLYTGLINRREPICGICAISLLMMLFIGFFDFYPIFYHDFRYFFFVLPAVLMRHEPEFLMA